MDVGGVGAERVAVAFADERLGSQVEDDLRLALCKCLRQMTRVAYVADDRVHAGGDVGDFKQIGLGAGGEGIAGNGSAHLLQPE